MLQSMGLQRVGRYLSTEQRHHLQNLISENYHHSLKRTLYPFVVIPYTIYTPAPTANLLSVSFFLNKCIHLLYFWLCWVSVTAPGLSLVAVSGGYSLVAMHELLIALTSLVVEPGLQGMQASVVAAHRW